MKSLQPWILSLILFSSVLLGVPEQSHAAIAPKKPKLVLFLVIDQFRSDYLMRFKDRFKAAKSPDGSVGGFQYLVAHGAYYPYAEYDILQCMTGPGHATVLTGSYPYQAGIPINDWFDRKTQKRMYCTEDPSVPTVGVQSTRPHVGTSPKNLIGTTVGDELKNSGYPSKVVSIALKDRAAILMGGHRADLSLWMDQDSFQWVSSRFYLPDGELPVWVQKINAALTQARGKSITWHIKGEGSGLSLKDPLILKNQYTSNIGETFPHVSRIGPESLSTPYGLELTATLAERAIDEFKLGQGKTADLLAVSFSSHDYLAHAFGPTSRELEEMTLADDQAISRLLNHVRKKIPGGLENVLIVLTADHGGSNNPTVLSNAQINAGRIDQKALTATAEAALVKKFGQLGGSEKWIPYDVDLNFNFNSQAIEKRGLNRTEVENVVREIVEKAPGIAHVFTATDYQQRRLPPGMHQRQILKTYFPGRSGDVVAIPLPGYLIMGTTADHFTGYAYDRTVPIVLVGPQFKVGQYPQKSEVIDIAPTLTYILGTMPPSLSEGRVLSESLK